MGFIKRKKTVFILEYGAECPEGQYIYISKAIVPFCTSTLPG